ncbi:MAG: hypothetical protein H6Q68_520 [Firmicutes bacterium]|nr:hypothetical protein [Bacillota bacterium]
MSSNSMSTLEEVVSFKNSGYIPDGLFQNTDGSGYIILKNGGEQIGVDLPTVKDVEEIATETELEIQESGF